MRPIRFLALTLLTCCATAYAGLDEGWSHFIDGDYQKAYAELNGSDDAEAQFVLGLMHDPHFHTLPYYFGTANRHPIYDGGLELDNKEMVGWYRQAVAQGHIGARFRFCQWSTGQHGNDRLKVKNSRCNRLYTDLRKLAKESDDPMLAYYAYIAGSGETASKRRHARAQELLSVPAGNGDRVAQFYLGRTYLQYNPRYDRKSDFVKAFAWFSAAAAQQNYHARVYQVFTAEKLENEEERQAAAKLAKQLMDRYAAGPAKKDSP